MKKLQISICGKPEVNDRLKSGNWDALVSIGPYLELQYTPPHVLRLTFNDKTPWERTALNNVAKAMHVLELHGFANQLPDGAKVLIHCGAGNCRSPAAAIVLLAAAGWPSRMAVQEVVRVMDNRGRPNGWLLKLSDVLFDTRLFEECLMYYRVKWQPSDSVSEVS